MSQSQQAQPLERVGNNSSEQLSLEPDKCPKTKKIIPFRRVISTLHNFVKKNTQIKTVRNCCSFAIGGAVELAVSPQGGNAHFVGLNTCRNTTGCPACSYSGAMKSARQLQGVAKPVFEMGGSGVMLTLTIPHLVNDDLREQIQKLSKCWNRLIQGKFGKECARLSGGENLWVRAFDYTTGENGHHPHLHNGILFHREITDEELVELELLCWKKWEKIVKSVFGRKPTKKAFLMERMRGMKGVSEYNNKIGSVAFEIASGGSINTEAKGDSLNIWQLIWSIREEENPVKRNALMKKWMCFEKATLNLKTITFSKTFREKIKELEEDDDVEEEIEETEEKKTVLTIREDLYKVIRDSQDTMPLLELYEAYTTGDESVEPLVHLVEEITEVYDTEGEYINQKEMERDWGFISFRIQRWMYYRDKPEFYSTPHRLLVPA